MPDSTSIGRRQFLASMTAAAQLPANARTTMGLSPDCFVVARPPRTAYEYLEYAHERGAGGVQAVLQSFDSDYLKKVRARAEQLDMFLEITTPLPKEDATQFEQVAKAAREAGALSIRSVCLSGRRYETFNSLDEWKKFVADSHARIERAARIVERHKIPLGIETHKDWTLEEMVPLMKRYSGEYLGACIDFGNNVALLDDPVELAEALAPFTVSAHIKDMAAEEYTDGFLLAEVALGQGFLELREMVGAIRKARPNARFSLDMLTRDALKVPCLTDKYWATFPGRGGSHLARTLRTIRANKPGTPIPVVSTMDQPGRLALEQSNVRQSVEYARDELGLKR